MEDIECQRQRVLARAQETPMLNRLIEAIVTGNGFGDVAALRAAAIAEQTVLLGPSGLLEAEPGAIAGYPRVICAYRELLDHLGGPQPDLVVWHGISVTYLWGPLCGGREGGVFVGGDALE
ncbi:MAG: hypothetical protein ACLQIK_08365 [Mycobacterium sp.]|uniref:hypothetical protein n=1 Tax=Mycobacterium sp. TaxID=1785 RepID=UPI003F9DF56B